MIYVYKSGKMKIWNVGYLLFFIGQHFVCGLIWRQKILVFSVQKLSCQQKGHGRNTVGSHTSSVSPKQGDVSLQAIMEKLKVTLTIFQMRKMKPRAAIELGQREHPLAPSSSCGVLSSSLCSQSRQSCLSILKMCGGIVYCHVIGQLYWHFNAWKPKIQDTVECLMKSCLSPHATFKCPVRCR